MAAESAVLDLGHGVTSCMVVKAIAIYGVARAFRADHRESIRRAALILVCGEHDAVWLSS